MTIMADWASKREVEKDEKGRGWGVLDGPREKGVGRVGEGEGGWRGRCLFNILCPQLVWQRGYYDDVHDQGHKVIDYAGICGSNTLPGTRTSEEKRMTTRGVTHLPRLL